MIDLQTDPGKAVLLGLFVALALLGVATLTGTIALIIWLVVLAILFVLLYAVLTRVAKWARGESTPGGEA